MLRKILCDPKKLQQKAFRINKEINQRGNFDAYRNAKGAKFTAKDAKKTPLLP
jgi:hypothetical protein